MSEPQVAYRHQYVSGSIWVATYPLVGQFRVVNRGHSEQHTRARLMVAAPDEFDSTGTVIFDSGDAAVEPEHVWLSRSRQVETDPFIALVLWAEIWTTSPDLVPSASFHDTLAGTREKTFTDPDGQQTTLVINDNNVPFAYFTPGDFAEFELPYRPTPPVPPVGPVEG